MSSSPHFTEIDNKRFSDILSMLRIIKLVYLCTNITKDIPTADRKPAPIEIYKIVA